MRVAGALRALGVIGAPGFPSWLGRWSVVGRSMAERGAALDCRADHKSDTADNRDDRRPVSTSEASSWTFGAHSQSSVAEHRQQPELDDLHCTLGLTLRARVPPRTKNKPALTPLPRSDPAPPWRICCARIPLGPSHLTRPLVTSRLVMAPAALCEFPPDPFQVLGRREAGPTVRSSIPPVHIPLPPRAYPLRLALLTPHLRPD